MPSKVRLSSELMWNILGTSFSTDLLSTSVVSLFDHSMLPNITQSAQPGSIFEITVSTSPDVTVQISDGGQAALIPSTPIDSIPSEDEAVHNQNDIVVIQDESLRSNPSWLWQHPSQFPNQDDAERQDLDDSAMGESSDPIWWELGDL